MTPQEFWLDLTTAINISIDELHSYLPFLNASVLIILIEGYFIKEASTKAEKIFVYFKFLIFTFLTATLLSQGLLGGCFIHTFQNAINLNQNLEVWNEYGLFYRNSIQPRYHILLRLFYLLAGIYSLKRNIIYYKKTLSNA